MKPVVHETTALGAAYAAGLAVGFWASLPELRAHWKMERAWKPAMDREVAEELTAEWSRAVGRSLELAWPANKKEKA